MKKWNITKTVNVCCLGAIAASITMFVAVYLMK